MSKDLELGRISVPFLGRVTQTLCGVFLLCALALFVLGPMESFRSLLGAGAVKLDQYYGFVIFIFSLCSLACYFLSQTFLKKHWPSESPSQKKKSYSKKQLVFQVLASLFILGQTLSQINMPFDLDENQRAAAAVTKSFWHEVTPFRHTEVHPVAHVAAITSMKLFGENKIAFRAPSVLFAIAFLVVLNLFSLRFLSPFASLLVFAHLSINQMTIWYMHAMRGYISAMFFTSILLYLLVEFSKRMPEQTRGRLLLWGIAFAISGVTHPFTGIFSLLLVLSLIMWMYFNRGSLSKERTAYGAKLILIATLSLPIFMGVFVTTLKSLEPIDNIHVGGFEGFVAPLFLTLPALGRYWALRGLVALLSLCGAFYYFQRVDKKKDFLSIFLFNTVAFYGAVLLLLKVSHLEPRWFIPFLIPFLLWVGQWVALVPQKVVRVTAMAGVLFLLTVMPYKMRYGILDRLGIWYHQEYEGFLHELAEKTKPISQSCYDFPDDPTGDWANQFHLMGAGSQGCKKKYFISLRRFPRIPSEPHKLILDGGNNYVAYLIQPKSRR